jgi:PAS domain-containing protein
MKFVGTTFVGTTMDVTEAKQAEARIRQSERELRQLLDLTPMHITEFGPDGSPFITTRPRSIITVLLLTSGGALICIACSIHRMRNAWRAKVQANS